MKKRKLFVGILMVSAVFGLAACDNAETNTTTTSGITSQVEAKYTIKFMNGSSEINTQELVEGSNITAPADPVKESDNECDYVFVGWFTEEAGGTQLNSTTKVTSNITYYARFDSILKDYEIVFMNGTTEFEKKSFNYNVDIIEPTSVPTKPETETKAYRFDGWFTEETGGTKLTSDVKVSGSAIYYAHFTEYDKVIDMNGKKYSSINNALNAIPTDSSDTFTITLPKGIYNENGLSYNGSATVKIKGDSTTKYGADVIIKGHGSDMKGQSTRNLLSIHGTANIILENITLESDWTRAGHGSNTQAEVIGNDTTGNTVAYNCSFKSHQDTIRTTGKAWFYGCYIEGDVDFIWMEASGIVALYEKCEIVSVYDSDATSHASYVTAPRMSNSVVKVGKGLVIYNSTVRESEQAKTNGQTTYLARTPWTSKDPYYNQVAYINTTCEDIESSIWFQSPIPSEYENTIIGWKMDQATATKLNYAGNNDILDATTAENEFGGRKAILNRIYHKGKQKYEKDSITNWDIDALITENGWVVDEDTSFDTLPTDIVGSVSTYNFDGSQDVSSLVNGFVADDNGSYVGEAGSTITIPVSGKCYIEVYGFNSGTVEVKANTQHEQIMFFNNSSTTIEIEGDYIVYDPTASEVVITAKGTTYITRIVVEEDTSIEEAKVSSIEITSNKKSYFVGVAAKLTAKINPTNATNKSVKWTSSDLTVGIIDEYSGIVTFLKPGTVTFTATACDGSGESATITCKPTAPTWTVAEWYTTDGTLPTENGAIEIGNFDVTGCSKASLNVASTFTNLSGKKVPTTSAIKLNGSGFVSVSTTKAATLTVVTVARISKNALLLVQAPLVYADDNQSAYVEPISISGEKETYTEGDLIYYTYTLPYAATWTITRGDGNVENSPLIYAKCEY